jgi:glucose/arabinose dehydrogenase
MVLGLLGAAAALLTACGAGASASAPTWIPQPSFAGEGGQPSLNGSAPTPAVPPSAPGVAPTTPGATPTGNTDPAVVATKLTAPDAIAILPDNTALVGERTTGRIVRVQPSPNQPVTTVRTLSGLDTSGGGGLLDLALSPNYVEDNLIFAYLSTPTDNRVVEFTLTGPVTAVLTGIPHGTSDNAGRIAFAPDGTLYLATGDAGHPALAHDATSLAGKILRLTDVGAPAPGNPRAGSPVYASGLRSPAGLCLLGDQAHLVEVEAPAAGDADANAVNLVAAGADYGWPSAATRTSQPLSTLPATRGDAGGCAAITTSFYVTTRQGKALLASALTAQGGTLQLGSYGASLVGKYGRLNTVVAAPDGALWLTTTNRDGHGQPVSADERVLRIVPAGASVNYPG